MKNRCLPPCTILRNVGMTLALVAGMVILGAELHAASNQQQQQAEALRRLFVLQVVLNTDQP
jgi:predicted lysophospholipase L1 biosynthesis ABC-type transport system permease subunit